MGVVFYVDRGRYGVDEVQHVGGAADLSELVAPLELVGDCDEVGGLATLVEVKHGLVDPGVLLLVEILRLQEGRDLNDRVGIDEQGAEHRLFGLGVGRHEAIALHYHWVAAKFFVHRYHSPVHGKAGLDVRHILAQMC
jgi:hypothetical protein